jgi:hypothetical protein
MARDKDGTMPRCPDCHCLLTTCGPYCADCIGQMTGRTAAEVAALLAGA